MSLPSLLTNDDIINEFLLHKAPLGLQMVDQGKTR